MSLRTRNKVSPEFNMSSLADIIFLLLIFFLLTSRIVNPNAIKVKRPTTKSNNVTKSLADVYVTKDLQYYVNNDMVPFEMLSATLTPIVAASNAEMKAISLNMDKNLPIQKLVDMYDLAEELQVQLVLSGDAKK